MEALKALIDCTEKILKGKQLILVCNSKGSTTDHEKYMTFQMETEYFSDDEFDQIVSMFSSIGIPMEFFLHEDDFFKYVILNNPQDIVVYNAAQSGTGPGRKSLVPAFCNLHGIPCTGSNAYVVSLCRHKYHVNKLLEQAGIPVPETWLYSCGWLLGKQPPHDYKVILKPIYESASIGIDQDSIYNYKICSDDVIAHRSKLLGQPIMAQQFIPGFEVELPLVCIGTKIVPLAAVGISIDGQQNLGEDILDYHRVYFDRYGFYDFSQKDEQLSDQLSRCASDVTRLLGTEGLCRVDFRINANGNFFVTDVSTNPHFVKHSSVQYAFAKAGMKPKEIAKIIISAALKSR